MIKMHLKCIDLLTRMTLFIMCICSLDQIQISTLVSDIMYCVRLKDLASTVSEAINESSAPSVLTFHFDQD